jgi:hypothetical protein
MTSSSIPADTKDGGLGNEGPPQGAMVRDICPLLRTLVLDGLARPGPDCGMAIPADCAPKATLMLKRFSVVIERN